MAEDFDFDILHLGKEPPDPIYTGPKKMVYGICTRYWEGWKDCVNSWYNTACEEHPWIIAPNMPIPQCLQAVYKSTTEPILAFIHDDAVIYEPCWDKRVLTEFEDESVGMVGFGGAVGHGHPMLGQAPFRIPLLARQDFLSNMRSAETHGRRFIGVRDVAVLDAFAIFVRRSVIDKWGGWPLNKPVGYFMHCETLCCEVRRQGLRIRLVGVDCEHLGGKSSGTPLPYTYEEEHLHFYASNRDMIPFRVP